MEGVKKKNQITTCITYDFIPMNYIHMYIYILIYPYIFVILRHYWSLRLAAVNWSYYSRY